MKIGIDFRAALTSGAGIGRYTRGLVSGLLRLDTPPREAVRYELYAFHVRRFRMDAAISGPAVRLRRGPVPARLVHWLGRIGYGAETHFGRVDLFHFTDFTFLPFRATPHVFTLHDVSFLVDPTWHEARAVKALVRVVDRLREEARLVFVHSEHTAREAVRVLGLEPERIRVAPPGVDAAFFRDDAAADDGECVRRRLGLPDTYLLSVGTLEPRKNLPRLIDAFGRLARHHPDLGLVLAGERGWRDETVFRAIESSPARPRIRVLGRVPEADLPALYHGATAFVYISLYEGFGLPVLEALAAGVPTVTSDAASLPEAAGRAAVVVDPRDTEAVAAALREVLTDGALRSRLGRAGPARAAEFTWERTARATLAGYREALGGKKEEEGMKKGHRDPGTQGPRDEDRRRRE